MHGKTTFLFMVPHAFNLRSFDVRRECLYREYLYLLPAEIIGIKGGCSSEEVMEHLSEFNSILKGFEVCV
jgi:tRNA pseudouridine38-40 synthase